MQDQSKMDKRIPTILALDFYDGATEGLARSVLREGPCYFKLIAWDRGQDDRLFGVVAVDGRVFQEFVEVTTGDKPDSSAAVRILKHVSFRTASGCDLEECVGRWRKQIVETGFLVCGQSVDDPDATRYPVSVSMKPRLTKSISNAGPEDLSEWQLKMK